MSTELISAGSGLVGAIIGAAASLLGTLLIEKRRWRREQRTDLLHRFTEGLLSGDRSKAIDMKVAFAMVGGLDHIRGFLDASRAEDIADNLNAVLRDVINEERAARGLKPLTLQDVNGLVLQTPGTPPPSPAAPPRQRR